MKFVTLAVGFFFGFFFAAFLTGASRVPEDEYNTLVRLYEEQRKINEHLMDVLRQEEDDGK